MDYVNVVIDDVEEDDGYNQVIKTSMFINYKKIKPISLNDPKLKTLSFNNLDKFYEMTPEEGLVFCDSTWNFLQYKYQAVYHVYPENIQIEDIKNNRFIEKMFKIFDVPECSYHKVLRQYKRKQSITTLVMNINDIILFYDGGFVITLFYKKEQEKDLNSPLYTLLSFIKHFKEPTVPKNKIYIVYRNSHGFDKLGFDVKKVNINIDENYNDDFKLVNETIIKELNNKNKTGLFILSGPPGTGKCVTGKTKVTIRNKKTNKIEDMFIEDLM